MKPSTTYSSKSVPGGLPPSQKPKIIEEEIDTKLKIKQMDS